MKLGVYLRLIRWRNLLLIVYTLCLIKLLFFPYFNVETVLSNFQFFLLILSVVSITASGYIINDIFDIKADEINKPSKVIVSKLITIEKALLWYKTTTAFGLVLGIALCLRIEKPTYSFLFIATALLLYYYAKILKGKPFIGNFLVALLIAISIAILIIFDIDLSIQNNSQRLAINVILLLSTFSFVMNLIREIVKDIEDIDGDKKLNINTLPILFGRNRTRTFALILCLIPIGLLTFLIVNYRDDFKFTMLYLLISTLLPLIYIFLKLRTAKKKNEFHKISFLLKLVMFFGINSLLLFSIFH